MLTPGWLAAEYQLLDRVVAIVEDDIVLASEVRGMMTAAKTNMRQRGNRIPNDDELYEQVLERQIMESLQLQRAKRVGMRVSDQRLNDAMSRIAASNRMDLLTFQQSIESRGESYAGLREQVRKEILIQEIQRRSVIRNISVSDAEVDIFLASEEGQLLLEGEIRIDHLLLTLDSKADNATVEAAATEIASLRKLANDNGALIAIRGKLSNQNISVNSLGWRKQNEIPELFVEVIAGLEGEQISSAIRSDSGYHLVQVSGRRGGVAGKVAETDVRHILISINEIRDEMQAKDLAREIADKLNNGEDFGELARAHSDDPGSALSGGALGWTEPGKLVEEFQTVMDNTDINVISAPFRSEFGWHILQVLDRRDRDVSEDRAIIVAKNAIAEKKYDDELNNWLQDLRSNAYIEIK